jgi:hypothetical protein
MACPTDFGGFLIKKLSKIMHFVNHFNECLRINPNKKQKP